MAPPSTLVALLIVLALVPGWLYLRLVESLEAPRKTSGLHQLLEVLAVGAATTGVSILVVILIPHSWLPFTIDVQKWGAGGAKYMRAHLKGAACTGAIVLGLSLVIAYGLAKVRRGRGTGEFHHSNAWVQGMGVYPSGCVPYLGLHLTDGRLLEGALKAYDLDDDNGTRDIALARPIRITPKDGGRAHDFPALDRVIVDSTRIEYITVIHLRVAPPTPARPRRNLLVSRR